MERNRTSFVVCLICALSLMAAYVLAESDIPYGIRDISYIQSSRPNVSAYPPDNTEAEAGNVTEINLNAIATTKTWQGYYGNITGTITLEDAYGYVFYNWSALEPKGEIYASMNNTISWDLIRCFDWNTGGVNTIQTFSEQDVEDWFNIKDDESDGIAETFNYVLDKNFFVGSRNISQVSADDGATCHATNTYRYDLQQVNDDFENVLLTDGDRLVFATIIENNDDDNSTDKFGFDNRTHDFQMLVAENGHDGFEDTTTTYYFWAEIQ